MFGSEQYQLSPSHRPGLRRSQQRNLRKCWPANVGRNKSAERFSEQTIPSTTNVAIFGREPAIQTKQVHAEQQQPTSATTSTGKRPRVESACVLSLYRKSRQPTTAATNRTGASQHRANDEECPPTDSTTLGRTRATLRHGSKSGRTSTSCVLLV